MEKVMYLFNPENDMALANFTPYYKTPSEIARMAADLSVLPAWYAPSGSMIKVAGLSQVILFREQCMAPGLFPQMEWSDVWENVSYSPWGWNPALLYTLRSAGVSDTFLLSDEQMDRLRFFSGRQRCVEVLEALSDIPSVCGRAVVCSEMSEVKEYVSLFGQSMLKTPWSGSGRGLNRISPLSWTKSIEGWVARTLRVQKEIMVEPLYNKVCDFAMEFCIDGNGVVGFAGYSLFETDMHGNYKGNLLLSDEDIQAFLFKYISAETLLRVKKGLMKELSVLLRGEYKGFLGVDMMICLDEGKYFLHPCVEINVRMNMGVVSRILFDRYVHPQARGRYVVEYYSFNEEALNAYSGMCTLYPLRLLEGRLYKGYFPLTPISKNTRYVAYLILD